MALIGLGRFDEALTVIGAARRDAVALGSESFVAVCRNLEALVHLGSGRIDDAATSAAAALADMATARLEPVEAQARAVLAEVAIRRGDLALARAHASRAAALADDVWDLSTPGWAPAWLEGAEEHSGPAPALDRAIASLRRRRLVLAAVDPSRLPLLVRIAGRRGEAEHARVAAGAGRLLAERNPGVRSIAGTAAHAEGLLHGDGTLLAGAVELLRAGPRPLALAEALEDLGRVPVATRAGGARAVDALEEAYERFTAAGAVRDAARVRWLLRERGTRRQLAATRYRPPAGWESLTGSEQATARLAADGLTNSAIARRLFVSPNTVGTHLRHAYAKLGVRSRVDLTRAVMRSLDDARG
jgi:DNA-binding CsgD family transcriptional regulator